MAKVESKNKQNPKLVQSELQDGRASLALEYYLGRNETPVLDENGNHVLYTEGAMKGKPKYKVKHIRKREVLNLYIWLHPRNQQERIQNKKTLVLAEKIRFEREQEFLEDREGYRLKKNGENDFIKYFRKHWENELYSKPVRCTYKTSYNRFVKFLEATPRFQRYTSYLRMELITPEMVTTFTDYLKKVAKGEGAHKSYYMFRTVILHAIDEGLMKKNPCKGIVIHRDVNMLKKEILTMDEIKYLASTHYEGEDTALQLLPLLCGWAMRKDGRQGYVSGFPFLRKVIASTATTAVNALCFSHRPTLIITNTNPCSHANGKSDRAHYNYCTGYNDKPLYPVQQYHPCSGRTEITPFGNSLAH